MQTNVSISPQVLTTASTLHKLDVRALQERFSHVPVEIADVEEPFPQSMRVVLSSHCEQRCQYPDEGILWCHNEGIARDALRVPALDELLNVVCFFLKRYNIRHVKIGGLEPVLNTRLLNMICSMREMGISHVSFTTHGRNVNGRLGELKAAGLTRVTISIQHFDRDNYIRLTGRDGLDDALALVQEARGLGLDPIQINRVLLKGYTDDLPAFLNWVQQEDVTARLYDLMWQPGHDVYYQKYLVSWQDFLPLWEREVTRISIRNYPLAWRTRIQFVLRSGGRIEANLFQPKSDSATNVCQTCPLAAVCAEGYLGCGIRVTPDLKVSPCILRSDLALGLQPLLNPNHSTAQAELVDQLLAGSPNIVGQPIQFLSAREARARIPGTSRRS